VTYRRILGFAFVFAVATGSLSACAAPPEDKGKGSKSAGGDTAVQLVQANVDYASIRQIAVAGHATGYKALPPGIAKNLARGKPLPPGIAKTRLPQPFVAQLPRHPGYQWQQAGTDLVLVVSGTYVVQDVLKGVFE
jgi:hypothetical protein